MGHAVAVALRKPVALITTGAVLVAGGLALIVGTAVRDDRPEPVDEVSLANADRVLQSVRVTMSPAGEFTGVDGTVVGTTTDGEEFTGDDEYSPEDASADLPVRVQASYRTPDGSGTDLSDLAGHDGPVQIQLTVQNLTVKPRPITYDVNGTERSRSSLVGVPLTVVASTVLPGVKPSAIRRTAGDDLAATDGVLSQDGDGATQVQWASLLAPPEMRSSTTLTLALDAHDFTVPDIDLSVQPGLVTDASVGALIDDAFNPSNSSQMELERRTIELIGQVNAVLARAGGTIDRVRSTLDDSAETLGTKTVSDLQTSASSITASVKGLDASVTTLGKDLTGSLRGVRSTTVEELRQMVQAVDAMLGDTSVKPPTAQLDGNGCEAGVPTARRSPSLYGNLLEVVGQLDGYARATTACRDALRASILETVGPAEPDAESCKGSASVTCALLGAEDEFLEIATKLMADGQAAVAALKPETTADAVDAATALSEAATKVHDAGAALEDPVRDDLDLGDLRRAHTAAVEAFAQVTSTLGAVHGQAVAGRADATELGTLSTALGDRICSLLSDAAISEQVATTLRAYVAEASCPATDGTSTELDAPSSSGRSTDEIVAAQQQAWSDLVAATDTTVTTNPVGAAIAATSGALQRIDENITKAEETSHHDGSGLRALVRELRTSIGVLDGASADLQEKVGLVKDQQDAVEAAVQKAFDDAQQAVQSRARSAVDDQVRQISDRVAADDAALGAMFDRSRAGLDRAASTIQRNGAKVIDGQRQAFGARQQAAGDHISTSVEAGLAQVGAGVSASTRDMTAASSLLSRDLHNVLLDLGTRKVKGSGLLGSMTTGAATAGTASYQLALASRTATSYANIRKGEVAGLLLRQAQTDAAMQLEAELPAFRLELPDSATHHTVYSFHLRGEE